MKANFFNFSPTFKKDLVSKNDIEDLMKNYAEEETFLSQPRKMLISSLTLQNRTLITPLFLFYLKLRLVCKKNHGLVEYTPKKCFNVFAQSAVDARRQGSENSDSSVVAKALKFLANSSYGYQITDPSHHAVTKYLTDKKTLAAINSKHVRKLDHVNKAIYEIELAKQILSTENQSLLGSLFSICKTESVGAVLQLFLPNSVT